MNTLERAVQAVTDTVVGCCNPNEREAREIVLAVLEAVREPDLRERMAGRNAVLGYRGHPAMDYSVAIGAGFTAMIDQILKGEAD